jgi:hypothetical protein
VVKLVYISEIIRLYDVVSGNSGMQITTYLNNFNNTWQKKNPVSEMMFLMKKLDTG